MSELDQAIEAVLDPDRVGDHLPAALKRLERVVDGWHGEVAEALEQLDEPARSSFQTRRDALVAAVTAALNEASEPVDRYRVLHRFYPQMAALLAEMSRPPQRANAPGRAGSGRR